MLQITIDENELWDEKTNQFINIEKHVLQMEHSLISISKWESKWCKSFISTRDKTFEETIDYIRCMTLNEDVDPMVYMCLTRKHIEDINAYIEAPMTATHFYQDRDGKSSREQITSELIYYWMITAQIPFECQEWHINRLFALIRVCNVKNTPPKKMSKGEIMRRNAALNAQRKQQLNTKG